MKRGNRFKDMTGKRFGKLTVVSFAWFSGKHAMWRCRCSCGETLTCFGSNLRRGLSRSCGWVGNACRRARGKVAARNGKLHAYKQIGRVSPNRTHNHSHINGKPTPEYYSWQAMKQRCTNPNNASWHTHGGRGVRVCTRWLRSFEAFLAYLGRRPRGKTLDRINPNGHYVHGNVRWADAKTQSRNQRRRHSNERVVKFVDMV